MVPLFSSAPLLEELAAVLGRPFALKRLALIGKSAGDVLADYVASIGMVPQLVEVTGGAA